MENLKKKILEKKELKGLNPEFLNKFLEEYKLKNSKKFKILEEKNYNEKSKEFEDIKKNIRKKVRELHGVFAKNQISQEKKNKYLSELKKSDNENKKEIITKILESHQSTFERIEHYSSLYTKILENYGQKRKIEKIVDLGCGYNPFAYSYLECTPEYFAVDINKEDSAFIQKYFDISKINGKAATLDLTEKKNLKFVEEETKNSDLCFMFKLLDSLESRQRGSSEELFKHVQSELIVVSFPLKTIGGKKEIKGKRKWFDKIKNDKKYKTDIFVLGNEIYYLLKQANS